MLQIITALAPIAGASILILLYVWGIDVFQLHQSEGEKQEGLGKL